LRNEKKKKNIGNFTQGQEIMGCGYIRLRTAVKTDLFGLCTNTVTFSVQHPDRKCVAFVVSTYFDFS
jgi:hypothetical protein